MVMIRQLLRPVLIIYVYRILHLEINIILLLKY